MHTVENERSLPKDAIMPYWLRGLFPTLHFRSYPDIILDARLTDNIAIVAEELAKGGLVSFNAAGVMAFAVDGHNPNAIDKIYEVKKRDQANPLIIGAGENVRSELIDFSRLPNWFPQQPSTYDLPHFFEFPIHPLNPRIGLELPNIGRVAAIFWANYYLPFVTLEATFRSYRPISLLVGSSANISGQPSLQSARQVYEAFGGRVSAISRILADPRFENSGPFQGSHTMLGIRDDTVVPLRAGAITAQSFQDIYPRLTIPPSWQEKPNAKSPNLAKIRQYESYLQL